MHSDLVGSSLGARRRDQEAHWEHARRSSEENRKTHRKNAKGYRISRIQRISQYKVQVGIRKVEGTTFLEILTVEPLVSDGCTAYAQVFGRLTMAEPPRPMVELPVPYFRGAFSGCTKGTGE
ncbi:hypothetical protein BHE74_00041183 [Ensete ventricosum]|nr:hypothetical protein BHE74_00041183 [Ensete ventricosum]RZS09343.1 hypothetical protein BHM03_00040416 [Ensete ventricosum]